MKEEKNIYKVMLNFIIIDNTFIDHRESFLTHIYGALDLG